MKKLLLFTFLNLFMLTFTLAQTTLLTEDFESDGEGSRYTSTTFDDCAAVTSDYFLRTNINPYVCTNGSFGNALTNLQGSNFWVSEDIDGAVGNSGNSFVTLTLDPLNVTGYSSITVSLYMATGQTGSQWEWADTVKIQSSWDGGAYTTIGQFVGNAEFGGLLQQDTDLDGLANPGAPDITSAFTNFSFNVPGTGTNLSVRIRLAGHDGSEEFAFDQIVVEGSAAPPSNFSPLLAGIESSVLLFTEGDAATTVTNSIVVSDADDATLDSAWVEICTGFTTGEDVLSYSSFGGITGTFNSATGMLKLEGNTTVANYQSTLRSVQYQNTNTSNPSNVPREICYTVNDGEVNSNTQSRMISIMDVITDPVCIPFVESFEADGEGITYVSNAFNDSPSPEFFFRTNTQPADHADAVTGIDGSYFWASEDVMSGSNGVVEGVIEFAPLTITGNTSFDFNILMGTSNSIGTRWEQTDNIYLQYNIDGAGWTTFGLFQGDDAFGGDLRVDTNNNPDAGPYGATVPNGSVTDFNFNFSGSGTEMKIRILVQQDGGSEELVFDHIRISGDVPLVANCTDITVYLDETGNATILPGEVSVGSVDDCGIDSLAVSVSGFDCNDIGDNTVVLTVFDGVGNSATCNATVNVMDTIAPVLSCNNYTVYLDSLGSYNLLASDLLAATGATDACGIAYFNTTGSNTLTCADIGSTPVTLYATDSNGNTASCNVSRIVMDTFPPEALCVDTTIYLDDTGMATLDPAWIDGGSSDSCGVTLAVDSTSFDCSEIGANTVTLTVTDAGLNTATCTATVTVLDTVSPEAICLDTVLYLDEFGSASIVAADINGGSTDACGILSLAIDSTSFDCSEVGANTVTLTVTDENNNTSTCIATVTVWDTVSPEAVCSDTILYLDEFGSASIVAADIDGGSTDACGILSLAIDSTSFDCSEVGANTVTLTVTDVNNNTSTCLATVTVWDTISPDAVCQNVTVYLDEFGAASIVPSDVDGGSTDACGILSLAVDSTSFDCAETGANTVVLTVIDVNSNTSTCEAIVTVLDTISPDFASCSNLNDTIECLGEIGNELIAAEWDSLNIETLENCVIENCEIDTVKSDYDWANFVDSCCNAGGLTVVYTAVDVSGNSSTFMAYFTVVDTTPPTFTVPNDTVIYVDENCEYDSDVAYTGDVTDESDICCETLDATYSDVIVAGDCPGNWIITRTWSLVDGCGNNAEDQIQIINVEDTIPPDVVTNDIEIVLYPNGEHTLNDNEIIEIATGTTDNCTSFEDLEIIVEPRGFECIHVGEPIDVKVTVIDLCGNSSVGWTTVTVYDETPPVALCEDLELVLDENGEARINPSMVNAGDGNIVPPGWARTYNDLSSGSYDACGISLLNIDQYNFDCSDIGENTVTLTVVDAHGNTSTCESTVTVSDNMVPVIEPVINVELVIEPGNCDAELEYPTLVVHDNCETTLELTAGLGPDGMFPVGTTTETWKATDDAGNTATVSFEVTIVATNAMPTVDEPTDVTVVEDTYSVEVTLTGISEGIDCEEQEISVTAAGDNPELITAVTVDYISGDSTGTLEMMIAPEMSGEAEIIVTVEDEEGGTATDTFLVTVTAVNDAPFVVMSVPDQTVNADHVLKVPVSSVLGELFDDIDDDMLIIEVMAEGADSLPAWATIMGDTLVCEPLIADTGCVNVVVTATDAGGLSVSDTFEICVDGFPVSIGELGLDLLEIQMYPNPTRGIVNLEMSSGVYEIQLSVHDITGKVVLRKQYSALENITFDMSEKVSGMYFVRMNIDGNQIVKKLIVNKE